MAVVSLRLPDDLDERLAREAGQANAPRAEVLRRAIVEYLDRRERERVVAALVAEARAGYADPAVRREALAVAEDFTAAEAEALAVAEATSRPVRGRRRAGAPR
jgi:predicted transcriptional regulator